MRATIALTLVVAAAAFTASAHAYVAQPCGVVAGPTAHTSGMTFDHYSIYRIASNCDSARRTVASILGQHLPNSRTPMRATGPAGWICVAQEVDGHIAVAGHCAHGRSVAISWVGVAAHVG
jgi:hypothetical protein